MAKCKTCGKQIMIPKGWSIGPAVRRHYWAKHPEIVQGNKRLDKNPDQGNKRLDKNPDRMGRWGTKTPSSRQ
jgi:hypothetical protein